MRRILYITAMTITAVTLTALVARGTVVRAQASSGAQTGELVPGVPIERELKSGEKHSYQVTLASGQFLHLRVNVLNIGSVIKVVDPDNQQLFSLDFGTDSKRIFLLAAKAGEYRLEISAAAEDAPVGRYELKIVGLETATPEDRSRFKAQQLKADADRLVSQNTFESLRASIEKYQAALEIWESLSDQEGKGETLHAIGLAYYFLGEKRKALDYLSQALPLVRAVGNLPAETEVLNDLGVIGANVGELLDSVKYYEQSMLLRRAMLREKGVSSSNQDAFFLYQISMSYRDLGEYQKALNCLRESLSLWGVKQGLAYPLYNMGAIYARLGDGQRALDYYDQALSAWQKEEQDPRLSEAKKRMVGQRVTEMLIYIGGVYASMGQWQRALDNYGQSLRRARAEKFWEVEARALNRMGAAYLSLSDYQKALECYNQSLPVFEKEGDRVRQGDTLRGIGEVNVASGEPQKALEHFNNALSLQRAIADQVGEAATLYATARAHMALANSMRLAQILKLRLG